jgi:GxxExxY protein
MITKTEITQLSYDIVGLAIKVHKELGPGLLESVYEKCLKYELEKNGYRVQQQLSVPIQYDELDLEADLKLDLLVNDLVIIELKSVEKVNPVYEAQLLTYMKSIARIFIFKSISSNIT